MHVGEGILLSFKKTHKIELHLQQNMKLLLLYHLHLFKIQLLLFYIFVYMITRSFIHFVLEDQET